MPPKSPSARILGPDILVALPASPDASDDVQVLIVGKAEGQKFDAVGHVTVDADTTLRIPVPKRLLGGASSDVVLRCPLWQDDIALNIVALDETGGRVAPTPATDSAVLGAIEYFDGELLRGWAFNPDQPTERLSVDIYVDNHRYASSVADERRALLIRQNRGDGRYGFSKVMPSTVLDGRRHVVACRAAGSGTLIGEPVEVDALALRQFIIQETLRQIRRLEKLFD